MSAARATARIRLWICLFAPGLVWFVFQQGLGYLVRADCAHAGPPGLATGAAALLVCLAAGLAAEADRRRESAGLRSFLARLAIGLAAIFGLAIAFQTAAMLLVPPCAR